MATPQRPLSPHLQVYRWQVQMVTSILHRATGIILAVGALLIACGLMHLAAGEAAWTRFTGWMTSPIGLVVLVGWTWALSYHLLNGVRHLVQDTGRGYPIPEFVRSSWASIIGNLVLTVVIFALAFMGGH